MCGSAPRSHHTRMINQDLKPQKLHKNIAGFSLNLFKGKPQLYQDHRNVTWLKEMRLLMLVVKLDDSFRAFNLNLKLENCAR